MENQTGNERAGELIESEVLSLQIELSEPAVLLKLTHRPTGQVWAEGPVIYRVQTSPHQEVVTTNRLDNPAVQVDKDSLTVTGQAQHLAVCHKFWLEGAALYEQIELRNLAEEVVPVQRLEMGLTWPLTDSATGQLLPSAQQAEWVPIPLRRHPLDSTGSYEEFSAPDLISRQPDYWFGRRAQNVGGQATVFHPTDGWLADGWCCTSGQHTLMVLKHATEHCEFCVLDTEPQGSAWLVRFGGTTLIQASTGSMPGKITALPPGQSLTLGRSRYEVVEGGWPEGYAAFRRYFDAQGYRPPENFNPPVHWNQLYDMTSWHTVRGYKDRREELYTLEALWEEARKAKEYHCEALYLDPGWDTGFASSLWDEERLGPQNEFVAKLKKDYGLELSLHCPLAVWCDASFYPSEALRRDESGNPLPGRLCSGSRQYLELKAEHLLRLCQDGATFLMLDGTAYTGPCFDPDHGHPMPYTPDDQALNYRWLCDVLQKEYPEVLIELHDVHAGGAPEAILPKHFPHRPGWNVENWGNEYMWTTYEDLFTGQMKYLDYVNRAYSIPMYLHISLINDNEHGLAFWYAASTCRHLGLGGTHPNPQVAAAQRGHMAKYQQLKRFFTQGEYYALDESTHLHLLPDLKEAVLLLFNFTDRSVLHQERFRLPQEVDLGDDLLGNLGVSLSGEEEKTLSLHTVVPARGVRVILLRQRQQAPRTMIW